MSDGKLREEIQKMESEIAEATKKIAALRRQLPEEDVKDYPVITITGETKLSALFGDKRDLIIDHYMGPDCPYCTLWADGFNGIYHHMQDRASFVLCSRSPMASLIQAKEKRGWRFPIVSDCGSFTRDMGFLEGADDRIPGASIFYKRDNGSIVRVGRTNFGPGDNFCSLWHFFAMLKGGPGSWQPKLSY